MNLKSMRFIGVSLAGGKTDKTAISLLEFFPEENRLFLSRLVDRLKPSEQISGDSQVISELLMMKSPGAQVIFDTPFHLPQCLTCTLVCPGQEACNQPQIQWMRKFEENQRKKKRPKRMFTPYTQRAIDLYAQTELEESFFIQHAMGANQAPLLARAMFLKKRIDMPCFEALAGVAVWRIGRNFKIAKSHLRAFRKSVGGEEAREIFLENLAANTNTFIYDQDYRMLIRNHHCFEALICSFTGFLRHKDAVTLPPKEWPSGEDWPLFPVEEVPFLQEKSAKVKP